MKEAINRTWYHSKIVASKAYLFHSKEEIRMRCPPPDFVWIRFFNSMVAILVFIFAVQIFLEKKARWSQFFDVDSM